MTNIIRNVGKGGKKIGEVPAIALCNPKYPRNVGQVIRASSCFGVKQVWFTGNRVSLDPDGKRRLPREERMKGYADVDLIQHDYFFEQFNQDVVPVAVEITPTSEILTTFEHPENALYVFGPEDGNVPHTARRHCHKFVTIPTRHCTNLAAAVYIVLSHRHMQRQLLGLEPIVPASDVLAEDRGWAKFEETVGEDYKPGTKQSLFDCFG